MGGSCELLSSMARIKLNQLETTDSVADDTSLSRAMQADSITVGQTAVVMQGIAVFAALHKRQRFHGMQSTSFNCLMVETA